MIRDLLKKPLALGELVVVGPGAGPLVGTVVQLPSALALPGSVPGQPQFLIVQIVMSIPVEQDGSVMVVRSDGQPEAVPPSGSVQ